MSSQIVFGRRERSSTMKTQNRVVSWLGSKASFAEETVSYFGEHESYFEGGVASASVLYAKPKSRNEVACDLHPDMINLLRVISNEKACKKLHQILAKIPHSEVNFFDSVQFLKSSFIVPSKHLTFVVPEMIERAAHFMVVSWLSRNGFGGSKVNPSPARRNTANGGSGPARWQTAKNSLPYWHERLMNVEFRLQSIFDVLPKLKDVRKQLVYIDPPYITHTRASSVEYEFDWDLARHMLLAGMLKRFRHTQIFVAHYRCEEYDDYFLRNKSDGWYCIELGSKEKLSSTAKIPKQSKERIECLYINNAAMLGIRRPVKLIGNYHR